jgi:hypothetical protein
MFVPLGADPDELSILMWQGFAAPAAVLGFVNTVIELLHIQVIEDLMPTPPELITSRGRLEEFLNFHTAPDRHFFISARSDTNGRQQEVQIWGDGPRARTVGLTPEVGIGLRPALLSMEPMVAGIVSLLRATLRWTAAEDEVWRIIRGLIADQATIGRESWSHHQLTA